ncbi:ATP-binding protein [Halobacillus fulvus]|nr:ATP-binding protein [Halobacillus fulvus]
MKTSFEINIKDPKELSEHRKTYYPNLVRAFGQDQLLVDASISEAVVNAWQHGHHKENTLPIRLKISFLDTKMIVRVSDSGEGFDWRPYQVKSDVRHWFPDVDELDEDGRGIVLLLRVMDVIRYNEKGNECLLMKKYVNQG